MICRRQSMAVLAISTSFVLMAWAVGASGAVPDARETNALLQFTAGGHVIGFDQGAIHVASRDHMLRVEMVGARDVEPVAESEAASAPQGAAAQPLGSVCYPNAWDGVTVVHQSGDQSPLKSTYQVAAGAGRQAIERIRLRYNRPVRVDDQGNLAISYESGEMIASDPAAWQETESGRTAVQADYRILGEGEVGFEVGAFDPNVPLVIDGELSWNTFLGGSGIDGGSGIAVDSNGNAYVTGTSYASWGSPARPYTALSDTFVAKLDASGSLVWNTFLGGSVDDNGQGIALDGNANAYVTGSSTASWGSPARPYTASADAFVAKLLQNPPGPTITQIKSKRSTPGSKATIIGSGFSTTKSDNVVYFGKKKAEVTKATATKLTVKIPSNCKKGKVNVYVKVKGVKSNTVQFTVK